MHSAVQNVRSRWRRVVVTGLAFAIGSVGMVQTVEADDGPCGVDEELALAGGLVCLHTDGAALLRTAPDRSLLVDAVRDRGRSTASFDLAAAEPSPGPGGAGLELVCDRSSNGRRVQVLYAHTAGNNDLDARRAELEDHVRFAQLQYDFSAFVAGSPLAYVPRLVTEGSGDDCRVKISRVEISAAAVTNYGTFFTELEAKGFDDPDRAYLVFVDEGPYCGVGTIVPDRQRTTANPRSSSDYVQPDDPDPARNPNNTRVHWDDVDGATPQRLAAYSRIDEPCWGFAEAHELGHNLGAVQQSAPHSTGGSHCTDGYDAMCYPDGSAGSGGYQERSCPEELLYFSLDCNNDDYFDPQPTRGSYLDTRWNIRDNDWLLQTFTDAAVVGVTVGPTGTRFDDVRLQDTFLRDIDDLARNRVTRGCNPPANTRFCPGQAVTRAQMAAFLTRALGLPGGSARFRDVPSSNTFRADIAALADAGITRGCNPPANTKFCPDAPVTREQMAAFLTRALGLAKGSATFTDVPRDSTFRSEISSLAGAGITRGCNPPENTRFCPSQAVTREQMAAFLNRAGLLPD